MKTYRYIPFLISIIILVLSIIVVSDKTVQTNGVSSATYDEVTDNVKGIWVSYITLDMQNTDNSKQAFEDKINSIIETTKSSGFNTLIVQVRPFGDALYNSKYYPWSHILTGTQGENPNYDPLEIICDLCHKNSIAVHAWINPYRIKSEQTPNALSDDNPYMIDNTIGFELNNCIYLDPSNTKAQKLIVDGVTEIVNNYDVDGIQFDDYFYPSDSDSIDADAYKEYKSKTSDPLSKELWRAQNVNTLIKQVYETVHKNSNDVVFGISPQGNIDNNMELGADVKTWCEEEGYIDYICPQIYFSLDNPALTFEESLKQWQSLNIHKKLKVYAGLAGYKGGTDDDEGTWLDNDDILKSEIEIALDSGLDGIMLYSYESFGSKENEAEIENVVNYLTGVTQ